MKKFIAKILLGLFSVTAFTPLHANESDIPEPGHKIVREVQQDYQNGKYDEFLSALHAEYERAGKAGVLRGLFESMKSSMPKELLTGQLNPLKDSERNQKLLAITTEHSELAVSKKVEGLLITPLDGETEEIFAELEALKYHLPEEDTATTENKISAIETEYHIKISLLEVAGMRSDSSMDERYKKIAALQFEKMAKLEAAVKESEDSPWKEKIASARGSFENYLAARLDYLSLKDLAAGKIKASNPTEEKVKEVMSGYLAQRQEAMRTQMSEIAQN
ncbi:MAG: hypothetical protein K940chlam2_00391 [Chlamydiae bacterium]|nr:hypothetical protein [Chlamydiota bacterium]